MPISGPSSYPRTIDEFTSHWAGANAQPQAGAGIVLKGGIAQSYLVSMGNNLGTVRDQVAGMGVEDTLAGEQLVMLVTRLQVRMVEFNARVRADFEGTAYARSLPLAFTVAEGEGLVRDALRKVSLLWTKIDAISPAPAGVALPLVLMGNYDRASFDTDRQSLREAFGALSAAEVNLRLAREQRNDAQDLIYAVLKAYRAKLPSVFPAGHAVLESMPVLRAAPGHTPDAVTAAVVWDVPAAQAKVTWTASPEADIARYEVRGASGESYVAADETVLATVAPGDARELLTDFALPTAGLTAGFKVYVVLPTGNERGSEAVYVTRPA